ncbi:hypothetical protein [Mesorhizobium sangaii]|uniref:Uncharacterized protein n=1 Tax=Mesorhizobium sangaii TaxID=505389 RepID=A0A841P9Y2_9HYPH|nr:hypothetical protein [Mesorhizobium sangaii]MBB6407750.1 hypothetical protein [Mesorhizobium sangaii]
MTGRYIVYPYPKDAEQPYDIAFQLTKDATEVPSEQGILKHQAERTLMVLRGMFQPKDARFRGYYEELLGLSRYGLVGETAQPVLAMGTLQNLQERVFDTEKGRMISAHMQKIIGWLFFILLAVGVAGTLAVCGVNWLMGIDQDPIKSHLPLILVLPGLLAGLSFSSFLRCRAVTFFDLHAIDADRFTPPMRAIFALILLFLTGAFLKAGVFEISIGEVHLSQFDANGLSAFIFGAFVGFSQEPLISRIESISKAAAPKD